MGRNLLNVSVLVVLVSACSGSSTTDNGGGAGAAGSGGATATGGAAGSGGLGGSGGVAGSGGTAGLGGGGAGSGGAAGVSGECTEDSDCQLVSDCCTCAAIPATSPIPPCNSPPCFAPMCDGMQIQEARCIAGQCTIAANCDTSLAACESLPPNCPEGQVVTVVGDCWGGCVPPTQCAYVEDCFVCGRDSACVVYDTQLGLEHHCVNPPAACTQLDCTCLATAACFSPFDLCTDGVQDGSAVHCGCPTC